MKIVGTACQSTAEPWQPIGEADRILLERILTEPIEYFDCPIFHAPEAEAVLFGRAAPTIRAAESPAPGGRKSGRRILDSSEENRLFQQFNYARLRQLRIVQKYQGRRMPLHSQRELLEWAKRAIQARSRIAEANTPLVMAMAKRVNMPHVDFCELLSEGNLALLRCISKFDLGRGFKFSTYACRSILKSFARVAVKTRRYRSHFPAEYDPVLDRGDLEERHHHEAEDRCLHEMRAILRSNRAALTATEQAVIRARFLPDEAAPDAPLTLKQIGRLIGVTKERARQIQNRALAKLRQSLNESLR
jgi:RNA polymerase sigma factor (sigma-70 family)